LKLALCEQAWLRITISAPADSGFPEFTRFFILMFPSGAATSYSRSLYQLSYRGITNHKSVCYIPGAVLVQIIYKHYLNFNRFVNALLFLADTTKNSRNAGQANDYIIGL
jgi:hypothetical protein